MSLSVPILQYIHQVRRWDALAILDLYRINHDRESRWEEVPNRSASHFKPLLGRREVELVGSCPTWHQANLIEVQQVYRLSCDLYEFQRHCQ